MNDAQEIRTRLLLSAQRALLGAVPASLRAVTADWTETRITLRFLFDGEVGASDVESAEIVGSEVVSDFPSPWTIEEEFLRLDAPEDLRPHALAHWVYRRKEPE